MLRPVFFVALGLTGIYRNIGLDDRRAEVTWTANYGSNKPGYDKRAGYIKPPLLAAFRQLVDFMVQESGSPGLCGKDLFCNDYRDPVLVYFFS